MNHKSRTLSILNAVTQHEIKGYEGYNLYKVTTVNGYQYGEGHLYILTREKYQEGDTFEADKGTEVIAVEGFDAHSPSYEKLPLRLYRPRTRVESGFTVKKEVLPQDWPEDAPFNMKGYNLYEAERKATNGYKGDLAKIFTQATYNPGEVIRTDEIAPTRGMVPHDIGFTDKQATLYTHDRELYQKRVWDTLKRACSHNVN